VISRVATSIDHVIEMTRTGRGTRLDASHRMQTVQVSIGEIIEAMYEGLIEAYGDRELALVAAQALGDDLLARVAKAAHDEQRSR
jgi:hypothetical protein